MIIVKELGLRKPTQHSTYRTMYVEVICGYCGITFDAQKRSIASGHTKSCGCLKNKERVGSTTVLRTANKRVYSIWKNMNNRVRNTNIKQAVNYSLKGITICDEWRTFSTFLEWALSNGYSEDLSIDRKDVRKGYFPDNCRWASIKVQSENTELLRSSNSTGFRGVSVKGDKFVCRATNNSSNIRVYLGTYTSAEEAGRAYDKYIKDNNLNYPTNFGNSIKKG